MPQRKRRNTAYGKGRQRQRLAVLFGICLFTSLLNTQGGAVNMGEGAVRIVSLKSNDVPAVRPVRQTIAVLQDRPGRAGEKDGKAKKSPRRITSTLGMQQIDVASITADLVVNWAPSLESPGPKPGDGNHALNGKRPDIANRGACNIGGFGGSGAGTSGACNARGFRGADDKGNASFDVRSASESGNARQNGKPRDVGPRDVGPRDNNPGNGKGNAGRNETGRGRG